MMKKILLACLMASQVSCSLFSADPKSVAESFWTAMQANDLEKARKLITPDSMDEFSEIDGDNIKIDSFELGELLEGETSSYIMVTIVSPDINQSFKTALQKVDGDWKVDYKETMGELTRAQIRQMGDDFREGMENVGQEMAEQFKGVAEAMKQGMDDMKKSMDESLKEQDQTQ
jgi:hypothetical protein